MDYTDECQRLYNLHRELRESGMLTGTADSVQVAAKLLFDAAEAKKQPPAPVRRSGPLDHPNMLTAGDKMAVIERARRWEDGE